MSSKDRAEKPALRRLASGAAEWGRVLGWNIKTRMNRSHYFSDRDIDFFVIGLQKCGTQWLDALLDNHPEVNCFPARPTTGTKDIATEGHLFDSLADPEIFRNTFRKKHGGFYRGLAFRYGRMDPVRFKPRMKQMYNAFANTQRMKTLVGEKTCEYVFHLDLMDEYYPDVKKLCILRDPRDRCVSYHFHEVRKGRRTSKMVSDDLARDYLHRVKTEYEGLLGYSSTPVCVLKYEGLHQDPMPEIEKAFKHLGVAHTDDILHSVIEAAKFSKLSGRKVGEEDVKSHFRKGAVGDWSNHLGIDQATLFCSELSDATRRLEEKFGLSLDDYLV